MFSFNCLKTVVKFKNIYIKVSTTHFFIKLKLNMFTFTLKKVVFSANDLNNSKLTIIITNKNIGFKGRDCDLPIDPCILKPCKNDARCHALNEKVFQLVVVLVEICF